MAFDGPAPDAADLSRRWAGMLTEANEVIDRLPVSHVGTCVMTRAGELFRGAPSDIDEALARDDLHFHRGRIRGALPTLV